MATHCDISLRRPKCLLLEEEAVDARIFLTPLLRAICWGLNHILVQRPSRRASGTTHHNISLRSLICLLRGLVCQFAQYRLRQRIIAIRFRGLSHILAQKKHHRGILQGLLTATISPAGPCVRAGLSILRGLLGPSSDDADVRAFFGFGCPLSSRSFLFFFAWSYAVISCDDDLDDDDWEWFGP